MFQYDFEPKQYSLLFSIEQEPDQLDSYNCCFEVISMNDFKKYAQSSLSFRWNHICNLERMVPFFFNEQEQAERYQASKVQN